MANNRYITGLSKEPNHWLRNDAEKLVQQFDTDVTVDAEGVVKWTKSGNFPPRDILELWQHVGKPFDFENTLEAKKKHDDKFFGDYFKRMANHKPSEEELFEMQSAFGKGANVVNVITGKAIKL